MKNEEIISKSTYFVFIRSFHRKQKKIKPNYWIKTQHSYYLIYEDSLTRADLTRIRKIADPNRNIDDDDESFQWRYKDYNTAHKTFTLLLLSGY